MSSRSLRPPIASIKRIVRLALAEDAATRDATTALIPPTLRVRAHIVARSSSVLAGIDSVTGFGRSVHCRCLHQDGDRIAKNARIVEIEGPARGILSAERVVLNLMARMTGIATMTRSFVESRAAGSTVKILDTRKTTPLLRVLEKYAVRCGGGENHRMDLSGAVFIKDNHLASAGLDELMRRLTRRKGVPIIIEADSLLLVREALRYRPDRILLDNMDDSMLLKAIALIRAETRLGEPRPGEPRRIEIELSGGITRSRIAALSRLDIDFISIGALTHSAPAADLSLEVVRINVDG